jgi:hypothetical protein
LVGATCHSAGAFPLRAHSMMTFVGSDETEVLITH